MAVALPANVASVLALQIRMVAAIAYISNPNIDLNDDRIKVIAKCCLLGESIEQIAKKAGIQIVEKLTTKKLLPLLSGKMLTKINQAVGFRLVTKFGSKGAINLAKAVPFLGAAVGGIFDGVSTNIVGNAAIRTFIKEDY